MTRFLRLAVFATVLLALTPGSIPARAQNSTGVEKRGSNKHAATLAPSVPLAEPIGDPVMWEVGGAGPEVTSQAGSTTMAGRPRGPLSPQSDGPEPTGWYSGDMHVHRSCGGAPVPVSTIYDAMVAQDISVVSLLADMGNGEALDPVTDLPLVTGEDDPISTPGRIIHWDAEWHWDAVYYQYSHQALGGHLNNLGLMEAHQIWDEYTYPITQWVHEQGGISGFVHMQYLPAVLPQSLSCCIPIEYPVEVALGAADYIAEDVNGGDAAIEAYYRLLNCGLRPGFAAGTDAPCGQVIGPLVTFAQVPGTLTYRGWVDAIARGRTVVSRVGSSQFLDLQVNGTATPGDEISLTTGGDVQVSIQWSANQSASGTIELVHNGVVVASQAATADLNTPDVLAATVNVPQSGWLCARVMGGDGHMVHTAAVFVTVAGAPVRASVADAQSYVDWIDGLIAKTSPPDGDWKDYFQEDLAAAQARYQAARNIYQQVAAGADVAPFVAWHLPGNSGTEVSVGANLTARFNEALDPATVSVTTFLLEDASHNPVAAGVTYDAGLHSVTLMPSVPLGYSTTYTATLVGGSPGIKDPAGTALAADESWSFTTAGQDLTPPTVTSHLPVSGATGVALSTTVTATFSEALDPATVGTGTFELRSAGSSLVPATVTLSSLGQVATLTPTSALVYATTYTATLVGGAGGIKDLAGVPLAADGSWSFTTHDAPPPPPDEGPGGPILVIGAAANPFTRYYAEILRNEGLNAFMVRDISQVDSTYLSTYDVAILGEMPLSAGQVQMLTDWVTTGGNLIAMRPDKQLAPLLGLEDAGGTRADAYLLIDTASGPGFGITGETMQYHSAADLYTLNGGTALATLYSDAGTPTANPAVTLRSVGPNGGQVAAFTFDLARSVVYTRQGNPAWAGQERDGNSPVRSSDLFYGNAAGDPQPNWMDLNKISIPQADEQQRLLANIILKTNLDRKPLPRFWYFPRGKKAVVIMTGDNHGDGGMAPRFDIYLQQSPANCSVDDWECIRASGYLFLGGGFSDAAAALYESYGFETALHVNTGCANFTPASVEENYTDQLASFTSKYQSIPIPESERNHCVVWSDWSTMAEVEAAHGSRLDTNYYWWFPGGVGGWPGMFTGSGMPMRFARLDGSMIDCYQAVTQMTDESGQSYPYTIDALLAKALGPDGYYGAFTTNMHFDSSPHGGSDAIVASAKARGVPVVSGRQMLRWLDGRNASKFEALAWNGTQHVLSFTITPDAEARNLEAMLPVQGAIGDLTGITLAGVPITYRTETIKGIQYGIFPAAPGNYVAQYLEDTFPPAISSVVATVVDDGIATITWTTNELSTSHVAYDTAPDVLTLSAEALAMVTNHSLTLTGLAANQTYYYRVSSTDDANNTGVYPEAGQPPETFTMLPLSCLKDDTEAQFAQGTTGAGTVVASIGNGAVTLATSAGSEFGGTALDPGWEVVLPPSLPGAATVAGGVAQLNGALIRTTNDYAPGRSVEFVATFTGAANEHAGLGVDLNNTQWAIFSTSAGGGLYARTNAGGITDLPISGSWFNAPHRYRIDWNPGSVVFFIDGNQVATATNSPTQNLRLVASDFANDATVVTVDWIRMTPYAASGIFLSRVYGGTDPATWGPVTWTAQTPLNTGLEISVHRGDTVTPDTTWTQFVPVAASGDIVGGRSRYIQYRAYLSTSDGRSTSALEQLHIACTAELDETEPVISGVSATPAWGGANVVWTTDEVANSRVDYGTAIDNLDRHVSSVSFSLSHSVQLTSLTPLTLYYYKITSLDPSGNQAVAPPSGDPLSFTTLAHTTPPVISGVTATLAPSGLEATIAWTTDEAATSVVLYGTSATNLNLGAEVTGLVTSHSVPLTGLAAATTYYYRVLSVDAYAVEATFPVAPTAPLSFGTPQEECFVDATADDFRLGNVGTGTYVEEKADGEVVLKPALSADFAGSAMPPGWVATHWGSAGAYGVSNGMLTVDSYRVMPDPYGVGPGHSVEFVATFGVSEAYQHVGFGGGGLSPSPDVFNTAPWAMFSTGGIGGVLQARTNLGGVENNQTIPGSWLGASHRYRVDWGDSKVEFYIDGALVATHTVSLTGLMRPAISDAFGNSAPITLDWLRVTPFAPSGTFTSRVFNRSTVSTWHSVSWTADTPGETGLTVGVRTGNTPAPDSSWTGFTTVASGQELAVHSRHIQYRAVLSSPDSLSTPALRDLAIPCEPYNDAASPVISAVAAAAGLSGTQATVTWTTDEVANARVDYGTAPDTLNTNVSSALFFTAHSLQLTGLTPGTTYYYRVTSVDPSNNAATSPVLAESPLSFATPAHTTPPVISAVVATPDPLVPRATVTWTTDEAATSVVRYGLSGSNLDLTASVGGLVTAHSVPLVGLAPSRTYYFRVQSADGFGNTAAAPAPPATFSFVTPAMPCPVDVTAADFALGALDGNTAISLMGDGEVILKPVEQEEFSGTSLPPDWPSGPWETGGTAADSGGVVTVDGGHIYSQASFGPGCSLEFVATYRAAVYQNIGFAGDAAFNNPWVVIGMGGSTDGVYARTYTGAEIRLSTTTLGSPHRYRIDWNPGNFAFSVDGTQVTTISLNLGGNMVVQVSDLHTGGNALSVDWLRVGPYPSAGSFTSRIFAGGGPTNWGIVSWNDDVPPGTSLTVHVRTGDTETPDATWTDFLPVANGVSAETNSRYVQYRADLATGGAVTPALQDIAIACVAGFDLTAPAISSVTATSAPNGQSATVTWATNEPANSRVEYGTSPSGLTLIVSVPARVRAHSLPLTGLTAGTTYYYRVISADGAGNSATEPDPPASPLSFATPAPVCFLDQTTADFSAGLAGTATYVSETADGEVILAPASGAEFSGTSLPAGWQAAPWGGTTPTVGGNVLTINGGHAATVATFGPGCSLEFVATFRAETNQHIGFTKDFAFDSPWAIFSTYTTTTTLYARVNPGGEVSLGTGYIGAPHRYRIDWNASNVVFSVDGSVLTTITTTLTTPMMVHGSDWAGPDNPLTIDWVRVTPYVSTGTFRSRIHDGGEQKSWVTMSWNATLPAGASLAMFARGGSSADTTDGTWTAWKSIAFSGGSVGMCSRYVQYRANLARADATTTPALQDVSLTCGSVSGVGASVTGLASAPAAGGNDASGRTKTVLTWSGGGGGGGGVKVYRKGYSGYPAYPSGPTWPPAVPASPAAAVAEGWTLTQVALPGQSDQPPTRDYWSYVAFNTDDCGNSSVASNVTAGTLNYLLGDVSNGLTSCAGNNVVNTADLSLLGAHYGAVKPAIDYLDCLDVGPTADYSLTARPVPDGWIEFEDLVLFALGFTTDMGPLASAAPARGEGQATGADRVWLEVPELPAVGEGFTVVVGAEGRGDAHALKLELGYDHAVVEMEGVEAGELLGRQGAQSIVLTPKPGRVDVALLGQGVGLSGSGELARARFRVKSAGAATLELKSAEARDGANRKLDLQGGRPGGTVLPAATSFAPAMPNPFAGRTTLAFALAQGGPVDLAIYAVDGRRVRTLAKDIREPGEYAETWDGRDDNGTSVAAGVYYARLVTPRAWFTRAVVLLK